MYVYTLQKLQKIKIIKSWSLTYKKVNLQSQKYFNN